MVYPHWLISWDTGTTLMQNVNNKRNSGAGRLIREFFVVSTLFFFFFFFGKSKTALKNKDC